MDGLVRFHDKYYKMLDRQLHGVTPFHQVSQLSGAPKPYLAASLSLLLTLFTMLDVGGSFITNAVGFGYPAYASILAIESTSTKDDTQWLTYWVIFASMTVLEYFSSVVLYFVPMYYSFKLAFVLWLYMPNTRGAEYLYGTIMRPLMMARPAPNASLSLFSMSAAASPPATKNKEEKAVDEKVSNKVRMTMSDSANILADDGLNSIPASLASIKTD